MVMVNVGTTLYCIGVYQRPRSLLQ